MTRDPNGALLERAELPALADPEGDGEPYRDVVWELHQRGGADVYERAIEWCRSESAALRRLGATVLAQLGLKERFPFRAASVPVLSGLVQDPEPSVVASSLHALGHLDAIDLEGLSEVIHHPSDDVRWALASCLGASAAPEGVEALIELSTDSEVSVRDWATFGLGSLSKADSPELRAALVARLDEEDDDTRGEALVGLASRRDERLLPYVERELQRDSVGRLALVAAGLLGDRRLLPHLRALEARCRGVADVQHAIALC